jgi:hypothetical protein
MPVVVCSVRRQHLVNSAFLTKIVRCTKGVKGYYFIINCNHSYKIVAIYNVVARYSVVTIIYQDLFILKLLVHSDKHKGDKHPSLIMTFQVFDILLHSKI